MYLSVSACDYDIILLTETWLTPSHMSEEYFNNEYVVYRCDRSVSTSPFSMGGGALIAVKRTFNCDQIFIDNFSMLEIVCIKLSLTDCNIYVICCYVPPNSSLVIYEHFVSFFDSLLYNASDKVFVVGDFNLPNLSWIPKQDDISLVPVNVSSQIEIAFIDSLQLQGFKQLNHVSNRYGKLLDLLFSSDSDDVSVCSASPISKLDEYHYPFVWTLEINNFNIPETQFDETFSFHRANYCNLNQHLLNFLLNVL